MSRLTSSPMTEVSRFRVVLDTNVILAALLSRNPASPTVELLHRWRNGEFALLYCTDLLLEYQEKLITKQIHLERRLGFLSSLIAKGLSVNLVPAEIVPRVLADPDDDVVLACALIGGATHLVTYDPHLLTLEETYRQQVSILDGLHFLCALSGDSPPVAGFDSG
jgi:putative PIN family toxin of toxin-antitoxin system